MKRQQFFILIFYFFICTQRYCYYQRQLCHSLVRSVILFGKFGNVSEIERLEVSRLLFMRSRSLKETEMTRLRSVSNLGWFNSQNEFQFAEPCHAEERGTFSGAKFIERCRV
jgi:hypothetical protein